MRYVLPPVYYIEHRGVRYAHFDRVRRLEDDGDAVTPPTVATGPAQPVTIEGVTWRSDRGWTAPHDVAIVGEYSIIPDAPVAGDVGGASR